MNIDHIEAFMYVVYLKSIHKAANALFLSQPTVTARIKTLEKELNTDLFIRQGRGIVLTEQGKSFIPYAEQIIQAYKAGKKQVKEKDEQHEIVIGANIISSQYFIPFALPIWKDANPQLRFKFISATNDILTDKLVQHQIDIVFMKELSMEGVYKKQVLDNSVRLVVYPGHSFINEGKVSVNLLAEESIVFFECGAFDWNRVHKLFEVSGLEPKIDFQVDHLEVAKSIVKSHQAIGFLPYLCIKNELASGELVEIDVSHLIEIKQNIFVTYTNKEGVASQLLPAIEASVLAFDHNR